MAENEGVWRPLDYIPEPPPLAPNISNGWATKTGRGGCEGKQHVVGTLTNITGKPGRPGLREIEKHCDEIGRDRCLFWVWSLDPLASYGAVWFCDTDHFAEDTHPGLWPLWIVGHRAAAWQAWTDVSNRSS